jgi:integrase
MEGSIATAKKPKGSAVSRWYEQKALGFPQVRGNGVPRYGTTAMDTPDTTASTLISLAVRGLLQDYGEIVRAETLIQLLDALNARDRSVKIPQLIVRSERNRKYIQIIKETGGKVSTGIVCEDGREPEDYPGALMLLWKHREEQLQAAMVYFFWRDVDVGQVLNRLLLDYEPGEGTQKIAYEAWVKKVGAAEQLQEVFNGVRMGELGTDAIRNYCRHRTGQFIRTQSADNPKRRKVDVATADGHGDTLQQACDNFFANFQIRRIKFERERIAPNKADWLTPDQFLRLMWATFGLQWDHDANDWKKEWRIDDDGKPREYFLLAPAHQRERLRMMRRFLLVYLLTGTRYDVILKLRWGASTSHPCIDVENGKIYRAGTKEEVGQQKPRDESPILPMALYWLRKWAAADKGKSIWVIQQEDGSNYAGGSVWRWVDLMAENAGVPHFTAHCAKHTGITFLNGRGMTLKMLSVFFGTSPANTEKRYSHMDKHVHDAAVAAAEAAGLLKLKNLRPPLPMSVEALEGPKS